MLHSPWLRKALKIVHSRKERRRQAARARRPVHLVLESLEERLTPAQTAGSYSELANAIAADTGSNTSYDIQITQNFQFNSGGQVSISKLGAGSTLKIEGQNGTNFTLTGNGNRLFTVASGQNVTLANLTLTGGNVTTTGDGNFAQGGALLDQGGNVTLSGVAIQGNSVSAYNAEGGGIYVSGGGNLTIKAGSTVESNSALGVGTNGNNAQGGGVYVNAVSTPSTLSISDSTVSGNKAQGGAGGKGTAAGAAGGRGGEADGGGVYVTGNGWNVTLTGVTFRNNSAVAGNGGDGAAGSNALALSGTGGGGGDGGSGGNARGGAAAFVTRSVSGQSSGTLTILNHFANPSLMMDNSVQGGSGGTGGHGGASTGLSSNSNGGQGGVAMNALGGALWFASGTPGTLTANIGNTSFYANTVTGGNGGTGGAAGTGGSGAAGTAGTNQSSGLAGGGALALSQLSGTFTLVNSTLSKNLVNSGLHGGGSTQSSAAAGGGILDASVASIVLDNNTITQNTINATANAYSGAGIDVLNGNPTLLNNLIQGNQGIGGSVGEDLSVEKAASTNAPLGNASDNFITNISANAVNSTSNIVGNTQTQLGNVLGVDANGNLLRGPVYYPLLSGTASIGAGTTSVLSTIAAVEGVSPLNAVDEIGEPLSGLGSFNLGAVQYQIQSPTISANPGNQTVTAGSNASFTAAASGIPMPTVQWQISTDHGKTFSDLTGANSTTLTLTNVQPSQNGDEYQAVFTNLAGTTTSSAATLSVNFAPMITKDPLSQTVLAGNAASFTAAANSNPASSVQWQISTDGGKTFGNINGATSTLLTLGNVQASENGSEYRAVFTNGFGSVTTAAATLTIQSTLNVTSNPASQTVTAGSNVVLTAAANGSPTPTVQWQLSTDGGHTFSNINGATSTTLTLSNVQLAQSGNEYRAVFTSSVGSQTTTAATLTVLTTPAITSANNTVFTAGQNSSFLVTTTGSPTPTFSITGVLPSGVAFTDHGNGTATLAGTPAATTGGTYVLTITAYNGVGSSTTQNFTLTVNAAPIPPSPPPPPVSVSVSPPPAPTLKVPALLGPFDALLGFVEIVNADGTETVTNNFLGIPLLISTYDAAGNLLRVNMLGFDVTFLFV